MAQETNSGKKGMKINAYMCTQNLSRQHVLFCWSALVIQHTRAEEDCCQSAITIHTSNVPTLDLGLYATGCAYFQPGDLMLMIGVASVFYAIQ